MEIQIGGFIGLFGGLLFGLAGWYFGRKKAADQRALDETHSYVWQKAKSFSWYVTIVAIYLIFILYLMGVTMSIPMILSMLMLTQLSSWAFGGLYISARIYGWVDVNVKFMIGIGAIIFSVILFLVLVLITENIYYLLCSIPFGIVGIYFINKSKQVE